MIPNTIHFIWPSELYKGAPFGLSHAIAVRSALEVNRPDRILFHCDIPPSGSHWDSVSGLVTLVRCPIPKEIFGKSIYNPAHRSDVLRLKVLIEHGGIYLDNDTVCVRPVESLLSHSVFIGKQSRDMLCNAVIGSEPGAQFMQLWLDSYRCYNGKMWAKNSCWVPSQLWQFFPNLLHVEPEESFYCPPHGDLDALFVHDLEFPNAYLFHLWSSHSWLPFLSKLTSEHIANYDTTYNRVARRFL